jgi:hypothetical protein
MNDTYKDVSPSSHILFSVCATSVCTPHDCVAPPTYHHPHVLTPHVGVPIELVVTNSDLFGSRYQYIGFFVVPHNLSIFGANCGFGSSLGTHIHAKTHDFNNS